MQVSAAVMAQHLRHAVTRFDRAEEERGRRRGRWHNPYGLGIMLARIDDEVEPALARGEPLAEVLKANFLDRLLTAVEKAAADLEARAAKL